MDIKNKKVLILGGWGLVGSAIAREIVEGKPQKMVLVSLFKYQAEEICKQLKDEFKTDIFEPYWGNIFVRNEFKDLRPEEYLNDRQKRLKFAHDVVDDLSPKMLRESTLYNLIKKYKPDIIIDCINTATGIAYQNIYKSNTEILRLTEKSKKRDYDKLVESTEKLLCSSYIPQLIRHIQILYYSMVEFKTHFYLKIGTSGTGGMGLNIPFTHSEIKPSRVLLSKSSLAGAQTLLLFLMARTPDGPVIKEIKPTASIAWKKIGYGEIRKGNKPLEIYNIEVKDVLKIKDNFKRNPGKKYTKKGHLKTVYIDTGENGIFSRGEFETITTLGQMEFVTPEEIAQDVLRELRGGNTGHDIISALDNSVMEPTYRAGFIQHSAVEKIKELEKKYNTDSVAFEMLGPPRLSKLLFEAHLIKMIYRNFDNFIKDSLKNITSKIHKLILKDSKIRNEIVSVGIPVLFPDGKQYLRGPMVIIPTDIEGEEIKITKARLEKWTYDGWVDLRESNWKIWKERFINIMKQSELMSDSTFSSRYVYNNDYWEHFKTINIGKVAGWIFINEEKGLRMKG